jgi:hypothetical protein
MGRGLPNKTPAVYRRGQGWLTGSVQSTLSAAKSSSIRTIPSALVSHQIHRLRGSRAWFVAAWPKPYRRSGIEGYVNPLTLPRRSVYLLLYVAFECEKSIQIPHSHCFHFRRETAVCQPHLIIFCEMEMPGTSCSRYSTGSFNPIRFFSEHNRNCYQSFIVITLIVTGI